MKRRKHFLWLVFLVAFLTACGGQEPVEEVEPEEVIEEEPIGQEPLVEGTDDLTGEYPYPEDDSETGEGVLIIQTASGDSSQGNVPFLFVPDDTMVTQIGYIIENFDGDKEVFFYINEMFVEAAQGGEMVQSLLDLYDWMLEPAEYEVTAVQYEGNDPNEDVVHLSKAQYRIEEGS
ncbi:hypothetical protein [Halalkalibacter alkaliphilus]|uniref:Lipoprotein n=1 Tax=Halalkalibacter alkaliphilus TaxID=2917993 RepID=A0A9X1ZYT4_9BACI|nr:hypothetical protein [Halalkalibacter alkaliphilus]MCL7746871.1 hypothetical protein [Halalkalibacter alkaliphilus]